MKTTLFLILLTIGLSLSALPAVSAEPTMAKLTAEQQAKKDAAIDAGELFVNDLRAEIAAGRAELDNVVAAIRAARDAATQAVEEAEARALAAEARAQAAEDELRKLRLEVTRVREALGLALGAVAPAEG